MKKTETVAVAVMRDIEVCNFILTQQVGPFATS